MRMQAVFCFFVAHVHVEIVHHGVRDFFAAVSRQAVADLAMSRSELQEFVVDLERQEVGLLRGLFAFLAHRNPDVAVENVGVLDGFLRVVEHAVLATVLLEAFLCFFDDFGGLFESLGAGEREVHADFGGEGEEGVCDVVAVTDEGDCLGLSIGVLESAEVFVDHLCEGDGLARVVIVGQGVHDRNRAVFGEFFDELLLEATDDDGVHPSAEAAGDVFHAFALAKADGIRGEEHGVAAELVHAYLECGDSSQRRLFEEHGDVLAVKTVRNLAGVNFGFEARGNLDGFEDFFFAPVHKAKEVFVAIYHLFSFGQTLFYQVIQKINGFCIKTCFIEWFSWFFFKKKTKKRSFYTPSYRKSQENANGY